MQILPRVAIHADALACDELFFFKAFSPSHTLLLSLSLTDVYTLISDCASTCALQTFFVHIH